MEDPDRTWKQTRFGQFWTMVCFRGHHVLDLSQMQSGAMAEPPAPTLPRLPHQRVEIGFSEKVPIRRVKRLVSSKSVSPVRVANIEVRPFI